MGAEDAVVSLQVFFELDVMKAIALENALDEGALVVADFEKEIAVGL